MKKQDSRRGLSGRTRSIAKSTGGLDAGRAALARGDWHAARDAFEAALTD